MNEKDAVEPIFSEFKNGNLRPLYKSLYRDLLLYASSFLPGNLAILAEDCVQDSIEKAYYERTQFASYAHLKAFLYRCIHNQAISLIRSDQASQNYYTAISDSDISEEDILIAYIRTETLSRLYNAIDGLPPEMRQLLELSFEKGLKNKEIANLLGVAEITIKKKKALMLTFLKKGLTNSHLIICILMV